MKAIHKVAGKDPIRPACNHIQVKDGFVRATNGFALIKSPVDEVFPKGLIAEDEELYFPATTWALAKVDKAASIERDGLLFFIKDKKDNIIGTIKALDAKAMYEVGRFPDTDVVLPNGKPVVPVGEIAFDPCLLADLCLAFGNAKGGYYYTFYGADKGILVHKTDSKSIGFFMPQVLPEL